MKKVFNPIYSNIIKLGESERAQYTKRDILEKITHKNGQLKLLIVDVEFLMHLADKGCNNVVYIGAAPGHHFIYLANMFPKMQFILYDPLPFEKSLYNFKNITIINDYFTLDTVIPTKNLEIFDTKNLEVFNSEDSQIISSNNSENLEFGLISDVRSGSSELNVKNDMEMQRKWVEKHLPLDAMLKFRLPWSPGKTNYLAGIIHTQDYIGPTSTEARVWVSRENMSFATCDYDNDTYNDTMFYYNSNRIAFHEYDRDKSIAGLDHCHDCWNYNRVINNYITSYNATDYKTFCEFYNWIKYDLNIAPHGSLPEERDISKKIFDLKHATEICIQNRIIKRNKRDSYYMSSEKRVHVVDKRQCVLESSAVLGLFTAQLHTSGKNYIISNVNSNNIVSNKVNSNNVVSSKLNKVELIREYAYFYALVHGKDVDFEKIAVVHAGSKNIRPTITKIVVNTHSTAYLKPFTIDNPYIVILSSNIYGFYKKLADKPARFLVFCGVIPRITHKFENIEIIYDVPRQEYMNTRDKPTCVFNFLDNDFNFNALTFKL